MKNAILFTVLFLTAFTLGLVAQVLPAGYFIAPPAGPVVFRAVVGTTVANCGPVIINQTQGCLVNDGWFVSEKGGFWTKQGASGGSAGVASFNGRTGAVISTAGDYSYSQLNGVAPVSSVNGRTGAVTLTLQ